MGERGSFNLYGFVENDSVNSWDFLGMIELVHATNTEAATMIVMTRLKPGTDGVIWMSTPNIGGSGASSAANAQLLYELKLSNVREVPDCVIREAAKEANKGLKGTGSANRGARFARLKGEIIARWCMKQPETAFVMKAPNPYYHGEHYILKDAGFLNSKPKLMKIYGTGSKNIVGAIESNQTTFKIPGKVGTALKVGGRVLFVVGIGYSAYEIYTAENTSREVIKQVGGWSSAFAGGFFGAKGGAAGGGTVGSAFAGIGAGPGAVIGGIVGGIGGGIAGWLLGVEVAETTYDWYFQPGFQYGN